jgi:hypothetical protein
MLYFFWFFFFVLAITMAILGLSPNFWSKQKHQFKSFFERFKFTLSEYLQRFFSFILGYFQKLRQFKSSIKRFIDTLLEYLQRFFLFIKGRKTPIIISFSVILILSLGISIFYHKSNKNTQNLIVFICQFAGALSLAFLFSKDIKRIDDYPISKALLGQIGVSIALIPFIFGIHADIFGDHDRQEGGEYNWFNLADIIKFPIDQLAYIDSPKPTTIQLASSKSDTATLNLIVLDNTMSGKDPERLKPKLDALKSYLTQSLGIPKDTINKRTLGQLIFLTTLDSFYPIASSNSKSKTIVSSLIYNGDNKNGEIVFVDSIKNERYLYETLEKLKPKSNTNTSYATIFKKIDSTLEKNEYKKVNLTLIGDFLDEVEDEDFKFKNFRTVLDTFPRNKIKFIQRFILKPNLKRNQTSDCECKEAEINKRIEFTERIIDEYFRDITIRDERVEALNLTAFANQINPIDHINNFTANTEMDELTDDYRLIYLYRPYTQFAKRNRSIVTLNIDNSITPKVDSIILHLKCDEPGINTFCNIVNNNKKIILFTNQPKSIRVDDIDSLELPSYNADIHSKMRIEFYQPSKTQKAVYRLDVKERLSPTSSIILLFLYNMLYGASLLFIYIYVLQNTDGRDISLWILPIILFVTVIFFISTSQEGLLFKPYLSSLCPKSVLSLTPSDLGKILIFFGIVTPFIINCLLLVNPENTKQTDCETNVQGSLFKVKPCYVGVTYLVLIFLSMFLYWRVLVRN